MKSRQINYLGFLSLLSLISVLGWTTGNNGFYGFIGFIYYVRYFRIIPDEAFQLNVQKAATWSFMTEMMSLVPAMYIFHYLYESARAIPTAFAASFVVAALLFSIVLTVLEWKESKGAHD